MKSFGNKDKPPTGITPAKTRDAAWDDEANRYWRYEEGKRDRLPASFEAFYQFHKAEFKNVLDVGGGTGRYTIPMLQDGLDVTLLEPSDGMRDMAEKNLKKAGVGALLVKGESSDLGFSANESFDLVFSKGAIHHNMWPDIQKSFREVARVLRPRKFFIFQGRSTKDAAVAKSERVPDIGITAREKDGWKKGVIQHYFAKEELERLAAENGLEIILEPKEIVKKEKGNARWWVIYRKI